MKKTNVKINYETGPWDNFYEKLDIALATASLPDATWMDKDRLYKYADDGVFEPVNEYLDDMQNFTAYMDKYPQIKDNAIATDGSTILAVNSFTTTGQLPFGYLYREDIFNDNNLEFPETFDELYESLKTLKGIYPDSTPLVGRWIDGSIVDAFGAYSKFSFDQDLQEFGYGPITQRENYVEALSYLRKCYSDGILDPEYSVTSHDMLSEKLASGKGFFAIYYIGMISTYNESGQQIDSNFHMSAGLPPVVESLGRRARVWTQYPAGGFYMVVSSQTEYKEEIFKYIDFCMSDEITMLCNWGWEDETYTLENGTPRYIEGYDITSLQELGIDGRSGIGTPYDLNMTSVDYDESTIDGLQLYIDNFSSIATFNSPPINLTTELSTQRDTEMESVYTLVSETQAKYIIGEIDETELNEVLDGIAQDAIYQKYLDYLNGEFDKIKDTWEPYTTID